MAKMASDVPASAAATSRPGPTSARASGIHICATPSNGEMAAAIVRLTDAFPEVHEHPAAQVSFLMRSTSAVLLTRSADREFIRAPFHSGSAVYIAPEEPHRVQWQGVGEMLNLYFPENFLREITEETGFELPHKSVLYSADPGVRGISQVILDELDWTEGVSNSIIDHARFLIAARLIRSLAVKSSRSPVGLLSAGRLQPAVAAMNAFPGRHFSLAELASLCNASVFHFARSFSARFGTPPFAYQRTLRLQKAQSLLYETDLSIEAIAYAAGIETATNFSRMFRRYTGYSPKEFRGLACPPCRSFPPPS